MIIIDKNSNFIASGFDRIDKNNAYSKLVVTDRYSTSTHSLVDVELPEYNVPLAYKLLSNKKWEVINQDLIDDFLKKEFKKTVPMKITPNQYRLQLLALGLLDKVETMASADKVMQIWFEYSLDFQRNDKMTISTAKQLGLTDEQIDNFFIEASKAQRNEYRDFIRVNE